MKKQAQIKKLSLSRQTVRSLDRARLGEAGGAMPKNTRSCNDCPPPPGGPGGTGGSDSYGFDCQTRNFC